MPDLDFGKHWLLLSLHYTSIPQPELAVPTGSSQASATFPSQVPMRNLIAKNSSQPDPLPMKYEVLAEQSVKISVTIGDARTGAVFFFLDGEPVITVADQVTVTPRTVTFAEGSSVRGKVLTVAANVRQGNAVGTDKWSMHYTLSGGKPASATFVNSYTGKGPIVAFQDTITFS